jgi:esterase/lipase
VLLVHGFSGTPGELRPLAERLADQGYSVEAPLLAGHGGSQEELATVTWRDWVLSARTALEALRARCHTIAQVGFSMGGAITLYMAAHRPRTGARGAEQPLVAAHAHVRRDIVRLRLADERMLLSCDERGECAGYDCGTMRWQHARASPTMHDHTSG